MAELTPTAETAASSCCAPEAHATCCEPSAKAECCGPNHGEDCECPAGRGGRRDRVICAPSHSSVSPHTL
jgi:hypothetical protein